MCTLFTLTLLMRVKSCQVVAVASGLNACHPMFLELSMRSRVMCLTFIARQANLQSVAPFDGRSGMDSHILLIHRFTPSTFPRTNRDCRSLKKWRHEGCNLISGSHKWVALPGPRDSFVEVQDVCRLGRVP